MDDLKQPERLPTDGAVEVRREGDDGIVLTVHSAGSAQSVFMSGYNAWRALGMMAIILGIPLGKKVGKAIKL